MKPKILLLTSTLLLTGLVSTPAHAISVAAHPTVHATTPHVTTTHTTVHTATPHATTTHTHTTTTHEPITHETKPATNTNHNKSINTTSHYQNLNSSQKNRLINNSHHYTYSQADQTFKTNNIQPTYRTYYHHQSVISNPWFWMFMIQNHRINEQHSHDTQYLKGYKTGYHSGQQDLKKRSRYHQNLTTSQENSHNKSWQNGYYEGYSDAITNHKTNK